MTINFILPGAGNNPCGGYKVVYEYANGLVRRGHMVRVIHAPHRLPVDSPWRIARGRGIYYARLVGVDKGYRPDKWFDIDPAVELMWLHSLHVRRIPSADAVIATSWESAEWVVGYPPQCGKKFYLVQHFEALFPCADIERVIETWRAPIKKIVISEWLRQKAHELGETAQYIPNGLDFDRFRLDVSIEERDPQTAMMLFHRDDWKGSEQGIKALKIVKEKEPEFKAWLFGVPQRPADLPDWIQYHRKPTQDQLRRLYNQAALFVSPSWLEGWGLPPCEAAQCGCALALTDIGGHREYGIANQTALLSPVRDPKALAANILLLINDRQLRIRLANSAHQYIQQFTWDRAVDAFEAVLSGTDEP